MNSDSKISLTREGLVASLREFILYLDSFETKSHLRDLAPDEQKMAKVIETNQKEILSKYAKDADQAYYDLRKVSNCYGHDQEVMQLLMVSASKEENAINDALILTSSPYSNLLELPVPEFIAKLQQLNNLQPQQMQQLQPIIQYRMSQLSPEQRASVMQTMLRSTSPEQIAKLEQQAKMIEQKIPTLATQEQMIAMNQLQMIKNTLNQMYQAVGKSDQNQQTSTTLPSTPSGMMKPSAPSLFKKD